MKRLLLFLCVTVLSPFVAEKLLAITPVETAKDMTRRLYNNLANEAKNKGQDVDAYSKRKTNFCNCFPSSDLFLPDEFGYIETGRKGTIDLICPEYFRKFSELANLFAYSFEIASQAEEIRPVEYSKRDLQVDFVNVLVKKTYRFSNRTVTLTDTICYNVRAEKIVSFANVALSRSESTFSMPIEMMRAEAARLCHQGKVKEGYEMYKKITQKADDGDSYYRMAVLVYDKSSRHRIGISNKEALRLTMQYLNNAHKFYNNDGRLRQKVEFMQYWIS